MLYEVITLITFSRQQIENPRPGGLTVHKIDLRPDQREVALEDNDPVAAAKILYM